MKRAQGLWAAIPYVIAEKPDVQRRRPKLLEGM